MCLTVSVVCDNLCSTFSENSSFFSKTYVRFTRCCLWGTWMDSWYQADPNFSKWVGVGTAARRLFPVRSGKFSFLSGIFLLKNLWQVLIPQLLIEAFANIQCVQVHKFHFLCARDVCNNVNVIDCSMHLGFSLSFISLVWFWRHNLSENELFVFPLAGELSDVR